MESISEIWQDVKAWFMKEKPVIDAAFIKANNVVNILKAIGGSDAGKAVIAVFSAFLPADVVAKATQAVGELFVGFGWAQAEEGKSWEQIIVDGFTAVAKMTGNAKAIALAGVAAHIATIISELTGGDATIQQAIVSVPLVYDKTILSTPAVADVAK